MKIQHSPLMTVTPHHAFLSDIAVLTQAWKKAHEYIRRHNWYADTLELDVSAVMLRELVSDWSAILGNRACRPEMYRPEPIRLVTAPKSAPWRVTAAEWKPVKEDGVRLRPLAHIAIRDQTLAVAAMICLADAVETAQRNPSPPFVPGKLAREVDLARAVSSYGNRLVCRWRERRAGFRWGNAETYRRFYEDYRAFVARAERALRDGAGSGARAVIHVDLSKFYDRIDRRALVGKLRRLAEAHYRESETSDRFFELLGNVFDWRWHPDDIPLLKRYQLADDGVGLPQGLVAAGFFANAYLIEFDRAVRRLFDERQRGRNWVIVDYFRYVDDIRVVVDCDRGPRDVRPDQLKQEVAAELERLLTTTTPGVTLNVGKTDVQIRDALPPVVGVARTMAAVQDVVSGPMDTAAATQVLDLIGGLFPVAERAADVAAAAADVDGGAAVGELARGVDGADDAFFADLFTAKLDVRPDTVERFAANRLLRTLRHLRAMSDDAGVDGLARAALDDRAAEFSKTLLRRWFADPSGVRLLRTAMNLLPLPRAFEFVRDRLWPYLAQVERHVDFTLGQVIDSSAMRSAGWARHACLYVAADLFRAAATETGFVTDPDVLPTAADVDGYRRAVCRFARECVGLGVGVPWFVHQQAVVALAVLDVPEQEGEGEDLPNARYAGARYALLAELLTTRRAVSPDFGPMSTVERVAIAIVAWRLARSPGQRERVIAYAVDATSRDGDLDIVRARELLKLEGGELADAVVGVGRKSPSDAKGQDDPGRAGGWRTLSEVIEAPDNPFRQENAALVLLLRLTEAWRGKHKRRRGGVLTPDRVLVRYADPNAIADPSRGLERTVLNLKITPTPPHPDSRFDLPPWCPVGDAWRIEIGRVVRAAVSGADRRPDAAASSEDVSPALPYRGLRGSHFKRLHGTFNGREALGGPAAAVSPWLCELLDRLLWWPGREPAHDLIDLPEPFSPGELSELLGRRLASQKKFFGRSSGVPFYEYPIHPPHVHTVGRPMTVVLAQTVLPRMSDFTDHGATLNDPAYRRRHRQHLSSVLALLTRTLKARATYGRQPAADLVFFPELSVHVDDLYLVERLIDKLKVIVFCGLVFHPIDDDDGPPVNCGMWLIPDARPEGRRLLRVIQGKHHLTPGEKALGIRSFRPCQWIIHGRDGTGGPKATRATDPIGAGGPWRLSASICYDATDLELAADLRNKTDGFVVAALNQDVKTFDAMVSALHYHMYQHVVLVNTGEFGGTTGQAPYRQDWEKVRVHCHGTDQVVISICELDLLACRGVGACGPGTGSDAARLALKTPPAGWQPIR